MKIRVITFAMLKIKYMDFKKLVARYLREVADKIDSDNCEIGETEAMDILKIISHKPLSKEQACNYLNIKRSKFDTLVAAGILPKSRKRVGLKELSWWQDELDNYLYFKEHDNK